MASKKRKLKECIQNVGKVDERLAKVLRKARLAFKETCAALAEWSEAGLNTEKNRSNGQKDYNPGQQKVMGEIAKVRKTFEELEKEVMRRANARKKTAANVKKQKPATSVKHRAKPVHAEG